jgi:uncharacterized protein YndB with AHSA1/START domain
VSNAATVIRPIVRTIQINDTPHNVFGVLIEPKHLKEWHSKYACVNPVVGGCYDCWGPNVYARRSADACKQSISRIKPDSALSIRHVQKDQQATWTYEIKPYGEVCHVTLAVEPDRRALPVEQALWTDEAILTLYNLREYVENGVAVVSPVYGVSDDEVTLSMRANCPPQRVFESLTEPDLLNRWIATDADVDVQPGGNYSYGWDEVEDGKSTAVGPKMILEVDSGSFLHHDWFYTNEPETEVRWEIDGDSSECEVRLLHSGFDGQVDTAMYMQGWAGYFGALKAVAEDRPLVEKGSR